MGTRMGEMREMLFQAMQDVHAGKLDHVEAKAIAALAAQVNNSITVELESRRMEIGLDAEGNKMPIGALLLGDETQ